MALKALDVYILEDNQKFEFYVYFTFSYIFDNILIKNLIKKILQLIQFTYFNPFNILNILSFN